MADTTDDLHSSGRKIHPELPRKKEKKNLKREAAIALIKEYAALAEKAKPGSEIANRYSAKIWRLSLKYKIRLGLLGRRICRNCHGWLVYGKTARVRFREGRIIITCLCCKNIRRIGHP